jgi:hypothetical protein
MRRRTFISCAAGLSLLPHQQATGQVGSTPQAGVQPPVERPRRMDVVRGTPGGLSAGVNRQRMPIRIVPVHFFAQRRAAQLSSDRDFSNGGYWLPAPRTCIRRPYRPRLAVMNRI